MAIMGAGLMLAGCVGSSPPPRQVYHWMEGPLEPVTVQCSIHYRFEQTEADSLGAWLRRRR